MMFCLCLWLIDCGFDRFNYGLWFVLLFLSWVGLKCLLLFVFDRFSVGLDLGCFRLDLL